MKSPKNIPRVVFSKNDPPSPEWTKKEKFEKKQLHQQGHVPAHIFFVERGRPLTSQTSKTGHTMNNFGEKRPLSALLPSALGVCMFVCM
jgi:hypothetical protein